MAGIRSVTTIAADKADALWALFAREGYVRVEPAILQPVDVFLDLSGEDIRRRMFVTQDAAGNELGIREKAEDELRHIDTSCLLIHRSGFDCLAVWLDMPKILSPICDRVFLAAMLHRKFHIVSSGARTVAFRTQYRYHFELADLPVPEGAKDPDALARELQDQFPRARIIGGDSGFEQLVAQVVGFIEAPALGLQLPLDVQGTAFQERVWRALRVRWVAHVLTPRRHAQVKAKFSRYGNRLMFVARFLPGLRTAVFLTAGMSHRVSFLRFIALDGLAALVSVPFWIWLGYLGAEHREWVLAQLHRGQGVLGALLVVLVAFVMAWAWRRGRERLRRLHAHRERRAERTRS